jgi:hypothetical protein
VTFAERDNGMRDAAMAKAILDAFEVFLFGATVG